MKKTLICLLSLALAAAVLLTAGGCHWIESIPPEPGFGDTSGEAVAALSLGQAELTVYQTASARLEASVSPEGTEVFWNSADAGIAAVDNGIVTGVAPGQTVITAVTADQKASASCTVTVLPLPELAVHNSAGKNVDSEALSTLKDLISSHPLSLSLYYKDINSGLVIEYNPDRKYQAGSVTKAPYIKQLIAGGVNLAEELTLQSGDITPGAGEIQNSPVGTAFTVEELITAALVNSDNTAYRMLCNRYGFDGFGAYAQSLGNSANQSSGNIFGNMSAREAARYFEDIYFWGVQSPEESGFFLNCLKNTSYTKLINAATASETAHKYGYNGGYNGFHDAAVVYSENPYVLAIFTTLDPDTEGTEDYITRVAACLDKINLS